MSAPLGTTAGTEAGPDAARGWHYVPALDGVRALAVVAVVLFHYWPDAFGGGFVGVDVFFVMSGYLITGIIGAEHGRTGAVDLRAFWGRRIRRLVPAVVVLVVVTAVVAAITGTGSSRQLADSVGALTWTTNLVEAFLGGSRVWLQNSRTTIDHLWSLAIEEQFYVVWPLVAALLLRSVSTARVRLAVVGGLITASAVAMGVVGGIHAYFRTDTRAFELLAGAALALGGWGTARITTPTATGLGAVGLGGLVAAVALLDPNDAWMYPWGFLAVTAGAAALVAAAVHPPAWLSSALCAAPVRYVGRVSYGVYLWHIPVLRVLSAERVGVEGPLLHVLRLIVLAVLVEASHRFVEEPFRRGRLPLRWPQFITGYAVAFAAVALLVPATMRDIDAQWDPLDGPPRVAAGERRVLVVGDLFGAALATTLPDDAATWSIADPGCPALGADDGQLIDAGRPLDVTDPEYCEHTDERWRRAVERFDPDVVVLAGGYWDTLDLLVDGSAVRGDDLRRRYEALVDRQVAVLEAAGVPAAHVVLVGIGRWDDLVRATQRGAVSDRSDSVTEYQRAVDAVAGARGAVSLGAGEGPAGLAREAGLRPAPR